LSDVTFTAKQGQYLAFIHLYTKLNGHPPAVADIQRYFEVTPPTAQSMVVRLTRLGLVSRTPRTPRSIRVLVDPERLPPLG
jgi:Mn-dependent DtxR family transcriptional regulator